MLHQQAQHNATNHYTKQRCQDQVYCELLGNKKNSVSTTVFYVCISSMTGYTCLKAFASILFVIGLLEIHQRSYVLSVRTKILTQNINCHRFHALNKRLNFLSFPKSDSSCFCHSFSVSPTGRSLCRARLLRIYKMGLIVFSNILSVLSTEFRKFWSPGTILNFINTASSLRGHHGSWSLAVTSNP